MLRRTSISALAVAFFLAVAGCNPHVRSYGDAMGREPSKSEYQLKRIIVLPPLDLATDMTFSYRVTDLPSKPVCIVLEAPTDHVKQLMACLARVVVTIQTDDGAQVLSCGGLLGADWIPGYEIDDRRVTHLRAPPGPVRFEPKSWQTHRVLIDVSAAKTDPGSPVVLQLYTIREDLGFNL